MTHHFLGTAQHVAVCQDTAIIFHGHMRVAHILQPVIELRTFEGDTCSWLHFRHTLEALTVHNTALSNVQCLNASLKNEAKNMTSNLQKTNENFLVVWHLVTQKYNNK